MVAGSAHVEVLLAGCPIGTVPPEHAKPYREVVDQLRAMGLSPTCRAVLRPEGDEVAVFVLGQPAVGTTSSPFLPPIDEASVIIDRDRSLPSLADLARHTTEVDQPVLAHLVNRSGITVVEVDGTPIGHLPGPSRRSVDEAVEAGFHATVTLEGRVGPDGGLAFFVRLPE